MNRDREHVAARPEAERELLSRLRATVEGDVLFDNLSRTIYATDASIYEIVPHGVVLPKSVNDVTATLHVCRECGVSIVPRGAGTGLTGGAVGPGVQLDLSRYMNHIGSFDRQGRTIDVEPGVVLDDLNRAVKPNGLQFAPDVATSSRATIGGMIANNACGAHSIVYGRTVDHVASLTVVLADGEVVSFDSDPQLPDSENGPLARVVQIEAALGRIRDEHHEEIKQRFPKILRSNGGYGLDRLGPIGTRADPIKVLCGSEGTLGVVVGATLRLTPLPKHTGLVVLHFMDVFDALAATPDVLRHQPAAVELVDRLILDAARANLSLRQRCDFLQGDPSALLIVEFFDDRADNLLSRMNALNRDSDVVSRAFASSLIQERDRQQDVWNLRNSGLGLLMSKPGDDQAYAFVEDSAVAPQRLPDYIRRFTSLLEGEGVSAGYYAHASVGCIHVRPVLNLKKQSDIEKMHRIADGVSALALEFGGTMTGEHGDGIARSCWLEKMYGPGILNAFREIKQLFDPDNLLNPHKIVDPWPMTEHLRYGPSFQSQSVKTYLDFSEHGGMAGLAGMCSGVGQCRQRHAGTMCPSFVATSDEKHTTRARANALRVALSNRGLLEGLEDPQLAEVMDLCLSCKACKTECPTGVDMARLKAEYLSRCALRDGVSRQARFVASMPQRLALASRFPRISNFIMQARTTRSLIERSYGFDRRVEPPRLATQTFRRWFRRHQKRRAHDEATRGSVIYFVDTWTNHITPQVGIAAVRLLEHAGFDVLCPAMLCCGRPAISKGLLAEARQLAESNVLALARLTRKGIPVVGTEPSCILTLVDEYPQLVRTQAARRIASQTFMIESFLRRFVDEHPGALGHFRSKTPLIYHAHCHQKAIVGSDDAVSLLAHAFGEDASEINSGCCGMAGSFGHEQGHYEVARAIGEERLFPAIRDRGNALVAVSGFSCRHQIEHHTDAHPRHVVEYLADALEL